MTKPILHTLNSGGSGFGYSHYAKWPFCPKAAELSIKQEETGFDEGYEEPKYFGVGRVFHALKELHYRRGKKGVFDTAAVRFSNTTVDSEVRAEAERLFRAYRVQVQPEELGQPVFIEQAWPDPKASKKEQARQAALIEEAAGISPFTFKPDLVTKMSAQEARRFAEKWNQPTVTAGYWMSDDKTESQWDGAIVDRFMFSHQFSLYQMCFNTLFPQMQLNGLIAKITLKYKNPEVKMLVVPPPSDAQRLAARKFLAFAAFLMKNAKGVPNALPQNCFPRGRTCYWFANGHCDRH